jgi:phosphoglycolate phosphatase
MMPGLYAVQAIIFDLDGTLVDSAEDLRAALNKLMGELNLRPIEPNEIKGMIGDGVLKLVERALVATKGDPEQRDFLLPRFLALYQANPAALTRCYPGVLETLDALRRKGFRLAVVTNKPVFATKKILEALALAEFFPVVIGGDSLPQRKPDPAQLLEAARQLGVDVDQTLMVGDNIHDVEAAHAAGMRCVAVSYGYHHRPPSEFNADRLIDRFDELPSLVINSTSNRSETGRDPDLASSTHPLSSGPERLA